MMSTTITILFDFDGRDDYDKAVVELDVIDQLCETEVTRKKGTLIDFYEKCRKWYGDSVSTRDTIRSMRLVMRAKHRMINLLVDKYQMVPFVSRFDEVVGPRSIVFQIDITCDNNHCLEDYFVDALLPQNVAIKFKDFRTLVYEAISIAKICDTIDIYEQFNERCSLLLTSFLAYNDAMSNLSFLERYRVEKLLETNKVKYDFNIEIVYTTVGE